MADGFSKANRMLKMMVLRGLEGHSAETYFPHLLTGNSREKGAFSGRKKDALWGRAPLDNWRHDAAANVTFSQQQYGVINLT